MTLARKMDGFWTGCQRRPLVPPVNNGAKAVPASAQALWCWPWWGLNLPAIECLTLGLSLRMNGVTLSYCYSGIIIPEDSGAVFCIAKPKSPDRLGVNPLDMPRTPYRASEGNPLSITHHAISPHPHIVICTSCIASMDCTGFSVIQCHLTLLPLAEYWAVMYDVIKLGRRGDGPRTLVYPI